MKVLIVDDENKARRLLRCIIEELFSEITTILEASDLETGVALIKEEQPQIVYLDIEMPEYSGLQIVEFLTEEEINFQIIFTTAYNKYAVDAFKITAIDYLLKPIDKTELKLATKKAITTLNKANINTQLNHLKNTFKQLALNKIALEIPKGFIFVSHEEIILFEADGMYTKVYLDNGHTEFICKPIKHFVEQLSNLTFFHKTHRSYFVNIKHIKELSKRDGHHLVMSNNMTIPISKDKRNEFMELIRETFNI
ncbi:LytTR family DNA-binding domain-containing protein [Aestuariibaculum sp. YM273]|uniref:LytR/AlgR family response regulator transcription factor n=1 Tax=Aestuariibaculum sp. YM273 TaxID=3070659 RepID=UPI0027DC8234|nr:LytTR family DNA-binding domain-containing protein [Aestuariibaculum sp. YM273]WMI64311.1 LytTR family DNA-binding domain-containing protein [Aestuariibaculum sp. YM273]